MSDGCAASHLGVAAPEAQLQLVVWTGTFHGAFALAPDTVEGLYLVGEPWYPQSFPAGEALDSVALRHQRLALAEFDGAARLFEEARALLREILRGLGEGAAPDSATAEV